MTQYRQMRYRRPDYHRPKCRRTVGPRSRGFVLIAVMVALAVALAIVVSWLQIIIVERQSLRDQQYRLQTEWLAESALARAAARLRIDPNYSGETWQVSLTEPGGEVAGEALIRVESAAENPQRRVVRVEANFPIADERRQRLSKDISVDLLTMRGTP
jgi:Tfp pilus assembly protein PilV